MKWLSFVLLSFSYLLGAVPLQDRTIDPAALRQLLSALDIPLDADPIAETQKRWLRKPGQERWDITEVTPEQRAFVLQWGAEQSLFSPWEPLYPTYDQALILGATTFRMQKRLDYLKQLWAEGVRFSSIVWLTGDRPLDPRADELLDLSANESEASHIIWEGADLPEAMRALPVHFIAVPMFGDKRPTTQDTIVAWLGTDPRPSTTALFVSDQPFCGYQFAVIKSLLPKSIHFEVVGQGVDPTSHPAAAAITLDSIARWIYTERSAK